MRGIAALLVFAVHLWIYQLPDTFELRRDSLWELVLFEARVSFVMFFVLSGYLLYRPFARAALQQSAQPSVRTYFLRRAARIVPAYYLALLGAIALVAASGSAPAGRPVEAADLPLFLVFGQNYSPETLLQLNAATWTLAVEVAFYALLPIVGYLAVRWLRNTRRQIALLGGLAVGGIAWNVVDFAAGWGPIASHSPPSFFPYFACGMLVALLVERRRSARLPALGRRASAALALGAGAVLLANGVWHTSDRTPDGFLMEAFADLPAAVAFGALIAVLVVGTGSGLRWVGRRPFAWFGQISYGFYLWHIPLIVFARSQGWLDGSAALDAALLLPVATAVGAASWYAVEQPLMRRAGRARRTADERPEALRGAQPVGAA